MFYIYIAQLKMLMQQLSLDPRRVPRSCSTRTCVCPLDRQPEGWSPESAPWCLRDGSCRSALFANFFRIVLNDRNHFALSELDSLFYFANSLVTLFLGLGGMIVRWLLGKNFFYEPKDSA